jgi:hypothetical protein
MTAEERERAAAQAAGLKGISRKGQEHAAGLSLAFFVFLLGALAGVALAVATDAVSRAGWAGAAWSLGGNGALVVPFSGMPAIAAGGWVALALWRVRHPRWATGALAAGLATLAAAGISGFGPVIALQLQGLDESTGPATVRAANYTIAATFVAPVVIATAAGLTLAALLTRLNRRAALAALALALIACVVVLPAPRGFFVWIFLVAPFALPLMAGLPVLLTAGQARHAQRGATPLVGRLWLTLACAALPAGLLAGVTAAQLVMGQA